MMPFWTYMLHCRGGVFYTGHTDDLERRIAEHKSGLMPGFARRYLPVELAWTQEFPTRYEALAAERQIKGWSRKKKLALIRGDWTEISCRKGGPSTSLGRTEEREDSVSVAEGIVEVLLREAERALPNEACGLLLGSAERIERIMPARNVHPEPARHFEIDPQALVDAHRAARRGGPEVVGYYHSHPTGSTEPSAADHAAASGDGRVWAIVGARDVTFWCDGDEGFAALSTRAGNR